MQQCQQLRLDEVERSYIEAIVFLKHGELYNIILNIDFSFEIRLIAYLFQNEPVI